MKRIANDIAVASLLYTMKPQLLVRIIDVNSQLIPWVNDWSDPGVPNGEILTVDEILHDYNNILFSKAKIRHTEVINEQLVLVIDTKADQY